METKIKTPATVRELRNAVTPEGWRYVADAEYYEGPASEAVDSLGRALDLSLSFDPDEGKGLITLGDPGSPFEMSPESARTLANQLLESADRLEVSIVEMDGGVDKLVAAGMKATLVDLGRLAESLGVSAVSVLRVYEKAYAAEAPTADA